MGLKCKITKKQGVIERVAAPNGKNSILYKDALDKHKSQSVAASTWATAYTANFNLYYGDWQRGMSENLTLDENGEPILSDVESYLDNMKGIAPPLTDQDRVSLRSLMISNRIKDIDTLNESLASFMKKGAIEVNRKTLTESSLYSLDEINRIMASSVARQNLSDLVARFNNMMLSEPSAKDRYLLSEDLDGDLHSDGETYNEAGKREFINPYRIENDLLQTLGGIKDRSDFDEAVKTLPYESIIEQYFADSSYADEIFNRYSVYDRVNVVDSEGNSASRSAASELVSYSVYDEKAASVVRSDIAALSSVAPDVWSDRELIMEGLSEIEKNAASMGIDLYGLESAYDAKTQGEIEDFLLGLDTFIASLQPGRDMNTAFFEDYDIFFSRSGEVSQPVILNEREKGLNMVVRRNDGAVAYNDVELYNSFGLIRIRGNLFHKVERASRDELYDTLYEINSISDKPMFPFGDLKGKTREEAIAKIKEWANKNVTSTQSEEMVLNKAIFGFSVSPVTEDVDIQRELNRFVERSQHDPITPYDNIRLRRLILKEKIKNTPLYNKVLSNIVFDPTGFSLHLTSSDPISLKDIELETSGELKDLLLRSALHSNDESLQRLFFIEDKQEGYKTAAFYRDLYTRHPSLAPEMNVSYETLEDGMVKSYFSGDFVAIGTASGGVLMEKAAADGGMSVFAPINYTGSANMDYVDRTRKLKSDAYVLKMYDNSMTSDESYLENIRLAKAEAIENIIEKRSC